VEGPGTRRMWHDHGAPSTIYYGQPRAGLPGRGVECHTSRAHRAHVSAIKPFDDQHIRNRVLTPEEFQRMVEFSPDRLKPISLCAANVGMRKAEILKLTWGCIGRKAGFMRLKAIDSATKEAPMSLSVESYQTCCTAYRLLSINQPAERWCECPHRAEDEQA
jgi:hypothetical protein